MQILITDHQHRYTRSLNIHGWQLTLGALGLVLTLLLFSGAVYHFFFLTAVRDGWPVVSQVVKWVIRDESAQRDRILRDNLDALAQKLGEMQARMVKLEALENRVFTLSGMRPEELKALKAAPAASSASAAGGPYVALQTLSVSVFNEALLDLDQRAQEYSDLLALAESRLFESRLSTLMVPSSPPVDGPVGSGFGFRSDPFTGRPALHTGLDFPAPVGTPIYAAAGGMVVTAEVHPQYGRMLEIDHGSGLLTRYAHTEKLLVQQGDIVKRGQAIAAVGSTGRSTGAHLHFEVLVDGVPQNPARFLAQQGAPASTLASGRLVRPSSR
jgi:murein DD-endopeptidase MepM/ murein hydrolase activator NlpD